MGWIWAALGGAVGASLRWGVYQWAQKLQTHPITSFAPGAATLTTPATPPARLTGSPVIALLTGLAPTTLLLAQLGGAGAEGVGLPKGRLVAARGHAADDVVGRARHGGLVAAPPHHPHYGALLARELGRAVGERLASRMTRGPRSSWAASSLSSTVISRMPHGPSIGT